MHGALVDRDVQEAVAGDIEGDRRAGGHRHRAQVRRDQALIAGRAAQQGDVAAVGVDRALVQHRPAAGTGEAVAAGHEVGVADVQGGGHQAADIHLGVGAEHDAVRVDQEDLAVGRERAKDAGRVRPGDAVQGHGAAVRLREADGFALGDAEALPVEHRVLTGLGDRQEVAAAGQAGRAGRDRAAGGQGLRRRGDRQAAGRAEQGGAGEGAQGGAGDQSRAVVHEPVPCFGAGELVADADIRKT